MADSIIISELIDVLIVMAVSQVVFPGAQESIAYVRGKHI